MPVSVNLDAEMYSILGQKHYSSLILQFCIPVQCIDIYYQLWFVLFKWKIVLMLISPSRILQTFLWLLEQNMPDFTTFFVKIVMDVAIFSTCVSLHCVIWGLSVVPAFQRCVVYYNTVLQNISEMLCAISHAHTLYTGTQSSWRLIACWV